MTGGGAAGPPQEPEEPRGPATTVDVGAVVWGFAFLAVAAAIGVRAVTGVSWAWGWNVAGVLLLGGLATVVAALTAAGRARSRCPR
ncbi:hypothetical protein [Kineococcus auxinigenes]|uniref:hypothetical protein n=1 Tax=unclassified Kineococcus TaxID=2621656 RepID=UPI003D7E4F1E